MEGIWAGERFLGKGLGRTRQLAQQNAALSAIYHFFKLKNSPTLHLEAQSAPEPKETDVDEADDLEMDGGDELDDDEDNDVQEPVAIKKAKKSPNTAKKTKTKTKKPARAASSSAKAKLPSKSTSSKSKRVKKEVDEK